MKEVRLSSELHQTNTHFTSFSYSNGHLNELDFGVLVIIRSRQFKFY